MKMITLPDSVNYIGVFLTLRCNLNCEYCINRQGDFVIPTEMSGKDWIKGLAKIPTRQDLPITLQGGEPTLYPDFYEIVGELYYNHDKDFDLLTNGMFDVREFKLAPAVFKRNAKYASIRFSYHAKTNPLALIMKVFQMQNEGYEVGIWGLDNNVELNNHMKDVCEQLNIDFRVKEFLSNTTGTYKYPDALNKVNKRVLCRTNELLINPSGNIFKCHADLYADRSPIGHILDDNLPDFDFRECNNCGNCNPCDVKLKTNRFQEFGYCAVEIKDFPKQ